MKITIQFTDAGKPKEIQIKEHWNPKVMENNVSVVVEKHAGKRKVKDVRTEYQTFRREI